MYKILIIEDDPTITGVLERQLERWGYETAHIADFNRVMDQFSEFDPQLVLLDISLPFFDGYHWCQEIRKVSKVPIIFLSSASDNMNLVMAIHMGADDFIPKPFDLNVVIAKIQALLRRTYSFGSQLSVLTHKDAVLNLGDATLSFLNQKVELTKNEFRILQTLFEHAGRTVSREEIIRRLWESESFIDDNTLTVNITRLRKKLEGLGLGDLIVTKKGLGYLVEGD